MGLYITKDVINDSVKQIPISKFYARIENYVIRNNPAYLDLKVRYFISKEIAEKNDRIPNGKVVPFDGILDLYERTSSNNIVKLTTRFSIPLIKTVDGIEKYDINIITDIYKQSYDFLKSEMANTIKDIIIENI